MLWDMTLLTPMGRHCLGPRRGRIAFSRSRKAASMSAVRSTLRGLTAFAVGGDDARFAEDSEVVAEVHRAERQTGVAFDVNSVR